MQAKVKIAIYINKLPFINILSFFNINKLYLYITYNIINLSKTKIYIYINKKKY